MSPLVALRDVALIARFEVMRALRTRRALALVVLFLVAHAGLAYLFVEALGLIERELAQQMGVPTTRWPGPLIDAVRDSEQLHELLAGLVGDEALVDRVLAWPLLAAFELWSAIVLGPFLAATAAAEAIALDVRSRAIRFEALRTGRAELVVGRFVGQLALVAVATAVALVGVWAVGMSLMAQQSGLALAGGLAVLGARGALFAVPFAALGLLCSAWTSSAAWARVLAVGGVAASWVIHGLGQARWGAPWSWAFDLVGPLLPQAWTRALWAGGADLLGAAGMLGVISLALVAGAVARVGSRDL